MRVCLVSPRRLGTDTQLVVPHGLLQLCAELKRSGHECHIVDYNDPETSMPYSHLRGYDLVGLSVMTTQLRHAVEIATDLGGHTRIVWGGVHCLLDPLSVLRWFNDHIVVAGEGEAPLLRVVEFLERGERVESLAGQPGVNVMVDGEAVITRPEFIRQMDTLADIDYGDLPHLERYLCRGLYYFRYRNSSPVLPILTSRGCSWDCSFCINSIFRQHRAFHRSKSIAKIRRETEGVIDAFRVKIVIPADEDFFVNRKLVEEWTEYAREKGFLWGANCRFNYFDGRRVTGEHLKELMEAGLFFVGMSIEAGSEDLRNRVLNKHVRDSEIRRAQEIIQGGVGHRLAVNTSFIVNFPGDTRLNKIETIKWMDFLSRRLNITFSGPQIYRPYPGSRLLSEEDRHQEGNLDYYVENIGESGSVATRENLGLESYFYSSLLQLYFNTRFRFFELRQEVDGRPVHTLVKADARGLVKKIVLNMLFLPVRLRLALDFWAGFKEHLVIAGMVRRSPALRRRIKLMLGIRSR